MAQTGTEILSYRGDPNLGLGSNANIPAISKDANLDLINQTARDIAMMNHANNIKLFDQKIKDRDDTLGLLAKGQISAGKIDPNDRKVYDESKKKVSDNFYEMIRNGGLNNPEAVRKYYDSVNDLQNVATWAQSRQLEFDKLNAEKSQQTLDEDIERFDGHIKKMKEQPFWNPIVPMQKAFNYDINEATSSYLGNPITGSSIGKGEPGTETTQWNTVTDKNGVITNKTTTKTAPLRSAQLTRQVPKTGTGVTVKPDGSLSEITYTPEKYWDYDTIQTNVQEAYIASPKDRQTQIEWFNDVNAYPDAEKIRLLKAYNNRIAQYNQERGIEPVTNPDGTLSYSNQIKYAQDPTTGKILIQETPTSFMAKHTLASIDGNYVEKPQALFNKDIANYKNDIRKINLDERELAQKAANDRGELAVKWANYGLAKDRLNDVDKEYLGGADAVLNEAIAILKNATSQPVYNSKTKTQETLLRISDPTLLQSFGTIDKDGTTTNVPDLINYDPKTNQPTLIWLNKKDKTGKTYEREVPLDQRTWLKLITKRSFPNKDIGKINSLLEDVLQQNGNSLYEISKKGVNQPSNETFKVKGKSYTKSDLNKLGYTDEQINEAIKMGTIQTK